MIAESSNSASLAVRYGTAAALPLLLLTSSDAFAEPTNILSLEPVVTQEQADLQDIEWVDRHTVLIVDVSSSVDFRERAQMMEGYGKALVSEESQAHFDSGLHYALSVVFFAQHAFHSRTEFINSAEDAAEFANEVFYDFENEKARPVPAGIGTTTNVYRGLAMAQDLFEEERNYGFQALSRTVVLAGDGKGGDGTQGLISGMVHDLATANGATVFGVPIVSAADAEKTEHDPWTLAGYFRDIIATPPGLLHNQEGFMMAVQPGVSIPASEFTGLQRPVEQALNALRF